LAGSITKRFEAFGIPVDELDGSDVLEIYACAGKALEAVRAERRPRALLLHTCRFGPHSKGDDTRAIAEVEQMRLQRDPLRIHGARLDDAELMRIEEDVIAEVAAAFDLALQDPFPVME
jgi:TPP-dependent pyruvate/acetoin dehydrogenase alpha subunit